MLEIRPFEEGDELIYVKVHNEGFSTEEWWMTAQMPISLADMAKLDYDATFMAEVEGQVARALS